MAWDFHLLFCWKNTLLPTIYQLLTSVTSQFPLLVIIFSALLSLISYRETTFNITSAFFHQSPFSQAFEIFLCCELLPLNDKPPCLPEWVWNKKLCCELGQDVKHLIIILKTETVFLSQVNKLKPGETNQDIHALWANYEGNCLTWYIVYIQLSFYFQLQLNQLSHAYLIHRLTNSAGCRQ